MSPPARGRGLKPEARLAEIGLTLSPPARGRGLKHRRPFRRGYDVVVAPRAGAWIETEY